jgi:7-keto-8-aminopelargonate synthetase-like enzyme
MASHSAVIAALEEGVEEFGISVSASRLTTGNHKIYGQLERAIADFFDAEAVLVTSGGYLTNIIAAQGLAGEFSHALIDERSHPSVLDAARFLDCPVIIFNHRDTRDVENRVRKCGRGAKLLLLTDGMFSHDGSAAPLAEYLKVLPKDALLLVDDCHAAGVLGKSGKGTAEHCGVKTHRIIQTITLSKAFGAYGGAIVTNTRLRKRTLEKSGAYIGNTPLPLPLANAALRAKALLTKDRSFLKRLRENAAFVKDAVKAAGLNVPKPQLETPGPILRIVPQTNGKAKQLADTLRHAGVFPPLTYYPGSGAAGAFRFVISSEHTKPQLQNLVEALIKAKRTLS